MPPKKVLLCCPDWHGAASPILDARPAYIRLNGPKIGFNQSTNLCIEIAKKWRPLTTLLKATANFCIEVATQLNVSAIICIEVARFLRHLATFLPLLAKLSRGRATFLNQSAILCLAVAKASQLRAKELRLLATQCYANVQNLPQESYLGQRGFGTSLAVSTATGHRLPARKRRAAVPG